MMNVKSDKGMISKILINYDEKDFCILSAIEDPHVFSSKLFPMEAITFTIRNKIFCLCVLFRRCCKCWNALG